MTQPDDSFGALRSALQQPPSAASWEHVCAALDKAMRADPTRFEEQLVPYADGALRAWPPALRVAPPRWYIPRPSPLLHHARALRLDQPLTYLQADALLAHEALDTLDTLIVPHHQYSPPPLHHQLLPALTHAAPALRDLDAHLMLGLPAHVAPLAQLACAPRLERLRLRGAPLGQRESMAHLLNAELGALRALELPGCELDAHSLHALSAAPWFGQLTRIDLSGGAIGSALWSALMVAGPLTALHIGRTSLDEQQLARVLRAACLADLDTLDISGNPLDHAGLRALPRAPFIGKLRALNLSGLHLRPAISGLHEAAPALRSLELRGCNISDACDEPLAALVGQLDTLLLAGVRTVSQLQLTTRAALHPAMRFLLLQHEEAWRVLATEGPADLAAMEELSLPSCALGSHGLRALCRWRLPALRSLRLSLNGISDPAALTTADMPALSALDLSSNRIEAPAALSALPPSLQSLHLSNAWLQRDHIEALSSSPPPLLRHLDLSSNHLFDAGLAPLLTAQLPHLTSLNLSSCSISIDLVRTLLAAPLPSLHTLHIAQNGFPATSRDLLHLIAQAHERGVHVRAT